MRLINRQASLWVSFAVLMAVGLAVLAVLSLMALRLENAEAEARRDAAIEENLRFALWRIDTALAPLVAQEGLRSTQGFTTQPEPQNDRTRDLVPPESLAILGRFEWAPDGQFLASESASDVATARLHFATIWQWLPSGSDSSNASLEAVASLDVANETIRPSRGAVEFQNRNQSVLANNSLVQRVNTESQKAVAAGGTMLPPFVPTWDSDKMILVRRTQANGREVLQGITLDWDALRRWTLTLIVDLLPDASLEPIEGIQAKGGPDTLASLPVRLLPGSITVTKSPNQVSVVSTLAVAWSVVLLAGLFGGALVYAMIQLNERRAAFVSAVTHELRTPLTTFQLYTEMLASGMVPDEPSRQAYLKTLQSEALRLNHLVDNVLAYARLERGRTPTPSESLTIEAIVDRISPRLNQLAARAEMILVIKRSEAFDGRVRVNVSAVEQILLNLVDNACKYAANAEDRRIVITATRDARTTNLHIRDHGPGMLPGSRWRKPFSKSAQEAAESSPGIGLGLALSGRLARQIGGSLLQEETNQSSGACFVLRLPNAHDCKDA